jgi:hypothetical protein
MCINCGEIKMAKRSSKTQKSQAGQANQRHFVVVAFADDMEQAREFEILLKSNEIPAVIKEQPRDTALDDKTIAVTVPEEFLDEALVVIESQDAYDDFSDFSLEDDESEFDPEDIDDNF